MHSKRQAVTFFQSTKSDYKSFHRKKCLMDTLQYLKYHMSLCRKFFSETNGSLIYLSLMWCLLPFTHLFKIFLEPTDYTKYCVRHHIGQSQIKSEQKKWQKVQIFSLGNILVQNISTVHFSNPQNSFMPSKCCVLNLSNWMYHLTYYISASFFLPPQKTDVEHAISICYYCDSFIIFSRNLESSKKC